MHNDFKTAHAQYKTAGVLLVERMNSFSAQAMVRGYYVYRDVWAASIGELLPCEREVGNASDRYAVAVMKDFAVVGHVQGFARCLHIKFQERHAHAQNCQATFIFLIRREQSTSISYLHLLCELVTTAS